MNVGIDVKEELKSLVINLKTKSISIKKNTMKKYKKIKKYSKKI